MAKVEEDIRVDLTASNFPTYKKRESPMNETYLMLDIEVSGPISALHSMIEFAVVHYEEKSKSRCFDFFGASLKEFDQNGGKWRWEEDTYNWWHAPSRVNMLHQIEAEAMDPVWTMHEFSDWLTKFEKPRIVAFGPDIEFLKLYWWTVFRRNPPFGLMAVDAKSFAMPVLNCSFEDTSNSNLRRIASHLFDPDLPHTHRALDDAKEQAVAFDRLRSMLNWRNT